MIRLLISSAGRRVELINCFRSAAKDLAIKLEIICIDVNPEWSPACQISDYFYKVLHCTDNEFIDIVIKICREHSVDLIIPTIDTELIIYSENRAIFKEYGTEILVSDPPMVSVARDKAATAYVLKKHDIATPQTWDLEECLNSSTKIEFPLMMKPIDGSGSSGIAVIESEDELEKYQVYSEGLVFQELCKGDEYTINAFYNREGKCVSCVPHIRKFVRAGEVCFAETKRVPEFTAVAHKLSGIFNVGWGVVCFQGFMDTNGSTKIIEINARFGGGYPICDKAGGTFARWILQDIDGQSPDYHDNWNEGVRMLRYDAAVFI